jgi:hypothetical protein
MKKKSPGSKKIVLIKRLQKKTMMSRRLKKLINAKTTKKNLPMNLTTLPKKTVPTYLMAKENQRRRERRSLSKVNKAPQLLSRLKKSFQ